IQNEPISEEELEQTKEQFFNSLVFRNTSYSQILNRIMRNEYRDMPKDVFEKFVEEVRNTTVADVQDMAEEYLRPNDLQILVVGKKDVVLPQLKKYGDVNIIDISIPEPGDNNQQQTVKGDAEKGAKVLGDMA